VLGDYHKSEREREREREGEMQTSSMTYKTKSQLESEWKQENKSSSVKSENELNVERLNEFLRTLRLCFSLVNPIFVCTFTRSFTIEQTVITEDC